MTRAEAIDILNNAIVCVFESKESLYVKALKMAIKALKEEPQWILCSERLPELGARVLVSDGENVEMSQLGKRYRDGYVWEFLTCWNDLEDWPYWMSLPEPWRGDAE